MTRAVRIIVPRMSGLPINPYQSRKPLNEPPCEIRKPLIVTIRNTTAAVSATAATTSIARCMTGGMINLFLTRTAGAHRRGRAHGEIQAGQSLV